jgi:transcriptional regulator with GAF, ATPase, and Fis domain
MAEAARASGSFTARKVTPSPSVEHVPSAHPTLEEVERLHILAVLDQPGRVIGGPKGPAVVLNLHPNTLPSRMKKLGIQRSKRDTLYTPKTSVRKFLDDRTQFPHGPHQFSIVRR